MKRYLIASIFVAFLLAPLAPEAVSPENSKSYKDGGVVLRFSRSMGSVVNPGEEVGFSFQTQMDGYVIVFDIDTEGFVHLLYPTAGSPHALTPAREWHSIPEGRNETLLAGGATGIEFVFAVSVGDKDVIDAQELAFLRDNETLPRDERYRIDGDPFLAANIIAGELVRGISHRRGVFLDYTYFYINERVGHPCYLCGECDGELADPLCSEYEITADFDRSSPLTYPLRRAYDMADPTSRATEDYGVAYDDDDVDDVKSRVDVTFYPYKAEVYYTTRPVIYDYDRDLDFYIYTWDPFWYDPWVCGWYYYPDYRYSRWGWYPYGHYFTWSFNWGYWGGYYCSPWFYPRHYYLHDYYCNDYYYYGGYARRTDRYKDTYKYKTGITDNSYKTGGSAFAHARTNSVRRDGQLKIATTNVRGDKYASRTVKKQRSSLRAQKDRGSYTKYTKTTRVKNFRGTTRGPVGRSVKSDRVSGSRYKSSGSSPRSRDGKVDTRETPRTRKSYDGSKTRSGPSKSGKVKKNTSKSRSTRYKSGDTRSGSSKQPKGKSVSKPSRSSGSKPAAKSSGNRSSGKSSAGSSSGRSSGKSKSGGKSKRK